MPGFLRRSILPLLLIYLALGGLYAFATPVFEASDEIWHYPVVREIRHHGRLPVQIAGQTTDWAQEGSQPPLYYGLAALATAWIDDSDYRAVMIRNPFVKAGIPGTPDNVNFIAHPPGQGPWQGGTVLAVFVIRGLSLLLVAGMVSFTWRLARTMYPQHPDLAWLAAALVAFNPMLLFISASVNNDNLLMVLAAATLWLLVQEVLDPRPGVQGRRTLILGLLLSLAALTKLSGLMLWPVAALALTWTAWRTGDWRGWLLRGLVLAGLGIGLAGWWYARNWQLYGELTGTARMAQIAGPRPEGFGLRQLLKEWSSFWYAYWGVFGAFNILAPSWFFAAVAGLTLLAGLGLGRLLWESRRGGLKPRSVAHGILGLFLLLTLVGIIRWSLLTPASQGRLLFGGAGVIALYLALGLTHLVPGPWRGRVAATAGGFMMLSALLIPFISIRPAYQPPQSLATLPQDVRPLDARFGPHIQLLGYTLPRTTFMPGEAIAITLYWRTDTPMAENLDLSLNGLGFHEQNLAKLDTWPGGGLWPTSFWRPGEIYPDPYLLPIRGDADTPTLLKLSVHFSRNLIRDGIGEPVPAYANGQPVDAIMLDAGALLTPPDRIQKPRHPPIALLDHGIQLHDYRLEPEPDGLRVRLFWSTTQPVPEDYTIFVHLRDSQGELLAQGDAPPREGYWPTSHWQPGQEVVSVHWLPWPHGRALPESTLWVGMYQPATGARLTIRPPQGPPWPDGAMRLR